MSSGQIYAGTAGCFEKCYMATYGGNKKWGPGTKPPVGTGTKPRLGVWSVYVTLLSRSVICIIIHHHRRHHRQEHAPEWCVAPRVTLLYKCTVSSKIQIIIPIDAKLSQIMTYGSQPGLSRSAGSSSPLRRQALRVGRWLCMHPLKVGGILEVVKLNGNISVWPGNSVI